MILKQLSAAELEVAEAVAFYEGQRAGLGLVLLDEIKQAYSIILEAPRR